MSYVADDADSSACSAGDSTQQPATNKAIDSNEASKIVNYSILFS